MPYIIWNKQRGFTSYSPSKWKGDKEKLHQLLLETKVRAIYLGCVNSIFYIHKSAAHAHNKNICFNTSYWKEMDHVTKFRVLLHEIGHVVQKRKKYVRMIGEIKAEEWATNNYIQQDFSTPFTDSDYLNDLMTTNTFDILSEERETWVKMIEKITQQQNLLVKRNTLIIPNVIA